MKRLAIAFLSGLFFISALAQDANWTKAERFSADSLEQYIKGKSLYPDWIKDSHYFTYDVSRESGHQYYLVNAKNGKKRNLIKDNERFVLQYARITGDTLDAKNIRLYGFRFENNDFNRFYLDKKGKSMVYNMNDGQLSEVPLIKKRIERPDYKQSCHSADSLYSMLGCGYDLFVLSLIHI